jgi:hypothetical protein
MRFCVRRLRGLCLAMHGLRPASSAIALRTPRCVREAVVFSERANVWMTTSENGEHDRISSAILV